VPVTVKIPAQLRASAGGEAQAQLEGATVEEVLQGLFERFGELRERISEEDGTLRRFVNVYLSGEDIRFLEGLQTPVSDGAELTILPAVAGGG
jgi:MoaD family protein